MMIALLSKLDLMQHTRARNLVIMVLLLAFGVCFEVSYFNKKGSNEHYSSAIHYTPESHDFPLSIPLSTGEGCSGIGDDFWEEDGNFIDLSTISVFSSESIYFHHQSNSQLQESLNLPFTPPESVTLNWI